MFAFPPDGLPAVSPPPALAVNAIALDIGFLSGNRLLYGRGCVVVGYSVREASGTPAQCNVEIRDGGNSAAPMVFAWNMPASTDKQLWIGLPGIYIARSLYGHQITGACVGAIHIIPND